MTGKIALAHLNEFPDYYKRLKVLEKEQKPIGTDDLIGYLNDKSRLYL